MGSEMMGKLLRLIKLRGQQAKGLATNHKVLEMQRIAAEISDLETSLEEWAATQEEGWADGK